MYSKIIHSLALCCTLLAIPATIAAQKLSATTVPLPLSKKGAKFGKHGGAYWDHKEEALQTFYLYSEKRRSPLQMDVVTFDTQNGNVRGSQTLPLNEASLNDFALEGDEAELEPESFSSFDKPVYWFKTDIIGADLVAFRGDFTAVYDLGLFVGYDFKKSSKKIQLLEGNQQLLGSFVRPFGPMVEQYSSQVIDNSFAGIRSLFTFGYVPAGDKVLLGGVVMGKVKLGQEASEDWNRYRIMTGVYNPETQAFETQQFFETDYTLWPLDAQVTEDGNTYAIYSAYRKGKLGINGLRGIPKGHQGLLAMCFDAEGTPTSKKLLASNTGFGARFQTDGVGGASVTLHQGEAYAVEYVNFKEAAGIQLARLDRGEAAEPWFFSNDELDDKLTMAGKEKAAKLKGITSISIDKIVDLPNDERLLILYAYGIEQYIMLQFSAISGKLRRSYLVDHVPASSTKFSTGVRGQARLGTGKEGAYPVSTHVERVGDNLLLAFRSQTQEMSQGVKSRTSSYSYSGYYTTTTVTQRRVVSVDEFYAFAKLINFDPIKATLSTPLSLDKTLAVGSDPVYVSPSQQVFLTGYAKKQPVMVVLD